MAQRDQASVAENRVAYLRGMLDGEKLSADQRLELALSTFVEVSERLIEMVAEVKEDQNEIKELLARFRSQLQSGTDGPGRSIDAHRDFISCPQCGQRLAVSSEIVGRGSIEMTCPECQVILEII